MGDFLGQNTIFNPLLGRCKKSKILSNTLLGSFSINIKHLLDKVEINIQNYHACKINSGRR